MGTSVVDHIAANSDGCAPAFFCIEVGFFLFFYTIIFIFYWLPPLCAEFMLKK